tara:strand:- start:147 stop:518 length:372 start_codon:yes stop_codon:yes gene_type:complete
MPRTTSSADKLFEVDVVDDEDVSIALLLHTKEASFLFSINLVLRLKNDEDEHVREEKLMTVWFFSAHSVRVRIRVTFRRDALARGTAFVTDKVLTACILKNSDVYLMSKTKKRRKRFRFNAYV